MASFARIAATIGFTLTLLGGNVHAQSLEYRFSFEVESHAALDSLSDRISIDKVEGSHVWAYANSEEMEWFLQTGISFELCSDKSSEKAIPMGASVAQMQNLDRYPTYPVYDTLMRNFERDYPQLCRLEVVATLPSGRQILALKISNNVEIDNTTKPEVLCTATMHGDEGICATTALNFCNHMLSSYGTDSKVNRLLDSIEFWVIPILNPDGMYNGSNNSISGSTRSNNNSYDLNRNFPHVDGTSGNTLQPETIAMMEFFGNHHFSLSTNLHGGNECFNYPWDTWDEKYWKDRIAADEDWWQLVGGAYRDTAQHNSASGYFDDGCGHSANGLTRGYSWYKVKGGQQDWANYFMHCREVTIEVCGSKEPTSTTTIANIWKYNKNSMLNFYAESLNGVRGTVTNAAGQPLAARITIAGHDIDNSWVETDIRAGDYHRFLKGGTYSLTFEAEGYETQTIDNVVVVDGKPTWLNVVMVTGQHKLTVSTNSVSISLPAMSTAASKIVIANISKFDDEYALTTSGNADWLTFDKYGQALPKGKTDTLTATISSCWLDDGVYSSVVRLESVSQTITINFSLTVNSNPVEMKLTSLPLKYNYSIGDSLNLDGAVIELKYCNDSIVSIALAKEMVSGFDSETVGLKTLTVDIGGQKVFFNIIVLEKTVQPSVPAELQSVVITALPDKRVYNVGDDFDPSGGLLTLTFSNDSTAVVPMENALVNGFSSKQDGIVLLTVKYGTFTNVFTISVVRAEDKKPYVVSAELTSLPIKLEYNIGQTLDLSGGQLTVTYSNDSTSVMALQGSMISGFSSDSAGIQWVTVSWNNTINAFCVSVVDDTNYTKITDTLDAAPSIYVRENTIVIENADAAVAVYNQAGRCVAQRPRSSSIIRIAVSESGVYIVRMGRTAQKVVIY
ncbi:MAG: bacterial Ig-like domain-containing protein [Salinivirgaceae bacterium]|nr:bacterial Ig-like domain-containing protein [Salinivirgaceae bacterium]